jgi:hypothetical protein
MWIRVALDRESVHEGVVPENTYVDGKNVKEYYFDDNIAYKLEQDGFLTEMWTKLDAIFDWGDCDYFSTEKSKAFKVWLENRIERPMSQELSPVYNNMLELAKLAIQCGTGVAFDF